MRIDIGVVLYTVLRALNELKLYWFILLTRANCPTGQWSGEYNRWFCDIGTGSLYFYWVEMSEISEQY